MSAAPTFDDIDANVHNLAQLLDTLVDNLTNVEYPAAVGALNRSSALAIIARDMCVRMTQDFQAALSADLAPPRQKHAGAAR